jgi:hypothetical protein
MNNKEGKKDKIRLTRICSAFFLVAILILSTFTLSSMTIIYDSETIRINEIMYNPAGTDSGHEWIEIYNKADYAINITGWRLYEQGTNHTLTLQNGSMEIPANGFAVIADNYLNFLTDYPGYSGTLIDSSFSLLNTGEYLAIKNDTLEIIDEVTYVPQTGANNTGMTIEYKTANIWEVSLVYGGTPGAPNSVWGPPFKPIYPSPVNNSLNVSIITPISVFVSDPDNDTMDVSFYNASDDSLIDTDFNVSNGSRAEVNWSDLQYDKTYEWYAIANDSIYENRSDTWTFTTMLQNNPPYKPSNPYPPDNATNISMNPTISVIVTDPDGDKMNVSFYNASDDSLIDIDFNVSNASKAEIIWYNLQYNTTYSWYAIADDGEDTNQSDIWNFTTTINHLPNKPTNPSPGNNSNDISINTNLSVFVSDPDNDIMDVYFYDAFNNSLIQVAQNVLNGTRAEVLWPGLQYNTTYRWFAVAKDPIFENRSDTWTFTTEKDPHNPPTIELIKPLKHSENKWWCYFRNKRIFRHSTLFIIGYIDIEVKATDEETGIERVEFYIDNQPKANVTEADENGIFRWTWNERIFLGHIIKIVAVDIDDGNRAECLITVFIINFRFLSWWIT